MRAPAALVATPRQRLPRPIILIGASLLTVALSYGALALRPASPSLPAPVVAVPAPADSGRYRRGDGRPRAHRRRDRDLDRQHRARPGRLHRRRQPLRPLPVARQPDGQRGRLRPRPARRRPGAADRSIPRSAPGIVRARVLFASHDFVAAEQAATDLLTDDEARPAALAILGDARLELGDYAGAAEAYGDVPGPITAPLLARQARLASVTGELTRARELAADARPWRRPTRIRPQRIGPSTICWSGRSPARPAIRTRRWPPTPPRSTRSRVRRRRWPASGARRQRPATSKRESRRWNAPSPSGPSPRRLPRSATCSRSPAGRRTPRPAMPRCVASRPSSATPGSSTASIVLFLADHGEDAGRGSDMAEAELAVRKDAYGWDAYAWALHAAGRHDEADAAIAEARSQGTEDALLDYHAGMIAAALDRNRRGGGPPARRARPVTGRSGHSRQFAPKTRLPQSRQTDDPPTARRVRHGRGVRRVSRRGLRASARQLHDEPLHRRDRVARHDRPRPHRRRRRDPLDRAAGAARHRRRRDARRRRSRCRPSRAVRRAPARDRGARRRATCSSSSCGPPDCSNGPAPADWPRSASCARPRAENPSDGALALVVTDQRQFGRHRLARDRRPRRWVPD